MNRDCIVWVVSDLHSNSHQGLAPLYFEHEGGTHKANPLQRWLWGNWRDMWEKRAPAIKKEEGLPLVAMFNGDAHDGPGVKDSPAVITRNEADQLRLAVEVIAPALDVADRMYIMRGTEAHTGKGAWREEALADDIGAERDPSGTASWYRLYAKLGGVLFDVRHHPETSGRKAWTRDSAHARIAFEVMSDYILNDMKPPQVVLRAHTHVLGEGVARKGTHTTRAFTTPPWQKTTSYGHRIAAGLNQDTGCWYFVCRGGRITRYDYILYEPRKQQPHRIDWNDSGD